MADLEINISLQQYIDQLKKVQTGATQAASSNTAFSNTQKQLAQNVSAATNSVTALSASLADMRDKYNSASDAITKQDLSAAIAGVKDQISQTAQATSNSLIPALMSIGGSVGGGLDKIASLLSLVSALPAAFKKVKGGADIAAAGISNIDKASAILFAISAVVKTITAAFDMFKEALNDNAEASGDWEEAMSVFTPILDSIKSAVSTLVGWIAKGMKMIAPYIPKAIRALSSVVTFVMRNFYKPIITVIGKIVSTVTQGYIKVAGIVRDGADALLTGISNVLRAFKMDDWADSVDKFKGNVQTAFGMATDMMNAFADACDHAGDYAEEVIQTIEDWTDSLADNMDASRKDAAEKRKLAKDEAKAAEQSAAAARKSEQAKRDAMNETNKEKKRAILEAAKLENDAAAKEQQRIARDKLRLKEQEISRKGYTSKEDKAALNQLRLNVQTAGTTDANRNNEILSSLNTLNTTSKAASKTATTKSDEQIKEIQQLRSSVIKGFQDITGGAVKRVESESAYVKNIDELQKSLKALNNAGSVYQFEDKVLEVIKNVVTPILTKAGGFPFPTGTFKDMVSSFIRGGIVDEDLIIKSLEVFVRNFMAASDISKNTNADVIDAGVQKMKDDLLLGFRNLYHDSLSYIQDYNLEQINKLITAAKQTGNNSFVDDTQAAVTRMFFTTKDLKQQADIFNNAIINGYIALNDLPEKLQKDIRALALAAGENIGTYLEKGLFEKLTGTSFNKTMDDIRYNYGTTIQKYMSAAMETVQSQWLASVKPNIPETTDEERDIQERKATSESKLYSEAGIKLMHGEKASKVATELEEALDVMEDSFELQQIDAAIAKYQDMIDVLYDYIQALEETGAFEGELAEARKQYAEMVAKAQQADAKRSEITLKQRQKAENTYYKKRDYWAENSIKIQQAVDSAIVTLGNMVIENQKAKIQAEEEAGKITHEEAVKRFEETKSLSISMAVLNALSTVPAQMYSIWSDNSMGFYAKVAATAATIVPTVAALAAQISQIKATTYGSDSTSSSSTSISAASVATAASTPLLDENQDRDRIQSIQGAQDQQVYILEKDIQESNKRVSVREKNSTF